MDGAIRSVKPTSPNASFYKTNRPLFNKEKNPVRQIKQNRDLLGTLPHHTGYPGSNYYLMDPDALYEIHPFTKTVREMVATAPENTEPVSIAKIEVTSSENTEPESL